MTRLVVTGGMGFIGSCFVRRRLAAGKDEVVVRFQIGGKVKVSYD